MSPRKPKPRTVQQALATAIKRRREAAGWTQEELALMMRDLGYEWSRSTVAEAEGAGRKRQVSVAELFGLARVLDVTTVEELLWPKDVESPLQLAPGNILADRPKLLILLASGDTLQRAVLPYLQDQGSRLATTYLERIKETATELRGVADYIEDRASKTLEEITIAGMSAEEEA